MSVLLLSKYIQDEKNLSALFACAFISSRTVMYDNKLISNNIRNQNKFGMMTPTSSPTTYIAAEK